MEFEQLLSQTRLYGATEIYAQGPRSCSLVASPVDDQERYISFIKLHVLCSNNILYRLQLLWYFKGIRDSLCEVHQICSIL